MEEPADTIALRVRVR